MKRQKSKSEMKRVEVLKGIGLPDELTMLKIGNAHLKGELKAHIAESEKFVVEATTKISELSTERDRLRKALQTLIDTIEDELRLDEQLGTAWGLFKKAADTARKVLAGD